MPDSKRPRQKADVTARAVSIMRQLTGEEEETAPLPDNGKNPAAQALGARGGAARAKSMTPERRAEIARTAAARRWAKRE